MDGTTGGDTHPGRPGEWTSDMRVFSPAYSLALGETGE